MFVLLPLRLICAVLLITVAYVLSQICMLGLRADELESAPLHGWRARLRNRIFTVARLFFFACGITRIRQVQLDQTQNCAEPRDFDHSIIVAAPHASYLDGVVAVSARASIVARRGIANHFVLGPPMRALQTIFIDRHTDGG